MLFWWRATLHLSPSDYLFKSDSLTKSEQPPKNNRLGQLEHLRQPKTSLLKKRYCCDQYLELVIEIMDNYHGLKFISIPPSMRMYLICSSVILYSQDWELQVSFSKTSSLVVQPTPVKIHMQVVIQQWKPQGLHKTRKQHVSENNSTNTHTQLMCAELRTYIRALQIGPRLYRIPETRQTERMDQRKSLNKGMCVCVVFSELTFNSNNNNKKKLVRFQCDFSCTFSEKYTLMSSPGVQQSQEVERCFSKSKKKLSQMSLCIWQVF